MMERLNTENVGNPKVYFLNINGIKGNDPPISSQQTAKRCEYGIEETESTTSIKKVRYSFPQLSMDL